MTKQSIKKEKMVTLYFLLKGVFMNSCFNTTESAGVTMGNAVKKTLSGAALLITSIVLAFTLAGCGSGDEGGPGGHGGAGNDGGTSSGYLGMNPTLTGSVYSEDYNERTGEYDYNKYTGAQLSVYSYGADATGTISGGQVSLTLGTPLDSYFENFNTYNLGYILDGDYDNLTVSPTGLKFYDTKYFSVSGSNPYGSITRKSESYTMTSELDERVTYVYVKEDVTISGKGRTVSEYGDTYKTTDFNILLKAGWNALYDKGEGKVSGSGYNYNVTYTQTLTLANPNLKWIMF
jgi:hypothetical protein